MWAGTWCAGYSSNFLAIERYDEVICSRDMACMVSAESRERILIAVEYVGKHERGIYTTHKQSQVIRELSKLHLIEWPFYLILLYKLTLYDCYLLECW